MIKWAEILKIAADFEVHRLETMAKHLGDLEDTINAPVQNWTDPYGRGYQYEFDLSGPNPSISLIVELSNVCNLAAAYFACRTSRSDGSFYDECGDSPFLSEHSQLRTMVCRTLERLGYDVIPHQELNVVRLGKPTYKWIFSDPED